MAFIIHSDEIQAANDLIEKFKIEANGNLAEALEEACYTIIEHQSMVVNTAHFYDPYNIDNFISISKLLFDEVAFWGTEHVKHTPFSNHNLCKNAEHHTILCLNMNDQFYPACADAEHVKSEKWQEVRNIYDLYGYLGLVAWSSIHRNEPVANYVNTDEYKDIHKNVLALVLNCDKEKLDFNFKENK